MIYMSDFVRPINKLSGNEKVFIIRIDWSNY